MACGTDGEGRYHTLGGWGQVLGDEGSAYHMALQGMQAAIRAHEGLAAPTALKQRMMAHFRLSRMEDIIDIVYNPPAEKSRISAFAPDVEQAAAEGDKVARGIITETTQWLYRMSVAISNRCGTREIGYAGSVLEQSSMIREGLASKLRDDSILLRKPRLCPEIGALVGAFRESGTPLKQGIIDHLSEYKP